MVTIAEEPLKRRFVAQRLSLGSVTHVVSIVLLIILPFIVAYSSDSLWLKEKMERERPEVHFQHEVLLFVDTELGSRGIFSSSPALNERLGDQLIPMSVGVRERDTDATGRPDAIIADVTVPVATGNGVVGLTMLFALSFSLQDHVRWTTNATAIVTSTAGGPASSFDFVGPLELRTDRPLLAQTIFSSGPPILMGATSETSLDRLTPVSLVSRYVALEQAVHLAPRYPLWTPGSGVSTFRARVVMEVPKLMVPHQPSVPEILKFAWLQYLAFLIPLSIVFRVVKLFAAKNQITPCRVVLERQQKRITDHDF